MDLDPVGGTLTAGNRPFRNLPNKIIASHSGQNEDIRILSSPNNQNREYFLVLIHSSSLSHPYNSNPTRLLFSSSSSSSSSSSWPSDCGIDSPQQTSSADSLTALKAVVDAWVRPAHTCQKIWTGQPQRLLLFLFSLCTLTLWHSYSSNCRGFLTKAKM